VIIALLVAALYFPSLGGALVWDDRFLVPHAERCLAEGLSCLGKPFFPMTPFLDAPPAYYRPVVTAAFVFLSSVGASTWGQHLFNVLLHAGNAVLLYVIARRGHAPPIRAGLLALVWAIHPRLVEAVAWISGRTDVIATTFALGAIAVWPNERDEQALQARGRVAIAGVLVFLGLLAKEVAIAAPIAIAASELARSRSFRRAAALAVPIAAWAVLRLAFIHETHGFTSSLGIGARIGTVFEALARYCEMSIVAIPWIGRGAIGLLDPPRVASGIVAAMALAYGIVRSIRSRNRMRAAGAALAVTSLLAVIHIVPIGLHGSVTADRLLYVPLAGAALAAASFRTRRAHHAMLGLLALIEAPILYDGERAFTDDLTFSLVSAERSDVQNVGPASVLATVVRDRGAADLACPLFEHVRATLERTKRTSGPTYVRALEHIGACWARTGRYDEAALLYRELEARHPTSRIALELGYALLHRQSFDAAFEAFARAERDPKLARLAREMQDVASAAAKRRPPDDPRERARFAAEIGRANEAEMLWLAIARDPNAPQPARMEALDYLAHEGSPPAAKAALDAVADRSFAAIVKERVDAHAEVMENRARILALTRSR
jgi:protein O-mannosyl-transferase